MNHVAPPLYPVEVEPARGGARGRAHWPEEDHLREWMLHNAGAGARGAELLNVRCDDGRLNVMLDTHILQVFTLYPHTHMHIHTHQYSAGPYNAHTHTYTHTHTHTFC